MSLQKDSVFDHVAVDRLAAGGTRVSWRMNEFFDAAGVWAFTLQVGESGIPEADDWATVVSGNDVFVLTDGTKRDAEPTPRTHYRIRLVADSQTYVSKPVPLEGNLHRRDWLRARAEIRRELLLQRVTTGVQGWVYRQKRKTAPVTDFKQVDPLLGTVHNSLGSGFGTDREGGYFAPTALKMSFQDQTPRENKIDENRGQVEDTGVQGLCVAYPQLTKGDVWVAAHSDIRYAVGPVKVVLSQRETPLMTAVSLIRLPTSDPIYRKALPSPPSLQTLEREEL